MNTYSYSIYWRYSSENFQYGIIKADSIEDAERKLKEINPNIIDCYVYEMEFDNDGIYIVYDH